MAPIEQIVHNTYFYHKVLTFVQHCLSVLFANNVNTAQAITITKPVEFILWIKTKI